MCVYIYLRIVGDSYKKIILKKRKNNKMMMKKKKNGYERKKKKKKSEKWVKEEKWLISFKTKNECYLIPS